MVDDVAVGGGAAAAADGADAGDCEMLCPGHNYCVGYNVDMDSR